MYLWGELNVYSMVLKTRESVTYSLWRSSADKGALWRSENEKENSTLNTESARSLFYHPVAYFLNDIS